VRFRRGEDGDVQILDEDGEVDELVTATYLLWIALDQIRKDMGHPKFKLKSRWETATLV
jgi:hypothetical protein